MNAVRRTALLLGLTAAVVVGSTIPASATFSATAQQTATLGTAAVQAPSNLKIVIRCDASTLYADVSWTKSTSARISAYAIDATINGGPMSFRAGPSTGTFTYSTGRVWSSYPMPVSLTVTAETQYGWTKASAPLNTTVTTC